MLAALKSLFKPAETAPPSRIGTLTYAIGDIHGRDDLFEKMIVRIRSDAAVVGETPTIVLLGDYIDRGPASRSVLDRILKLKAADWCKLVVLLGNHEEAMMRFMVDPGYGQVWTEFGGNTTLASYGVPAPALRSDIAAWSDVHEAFVKAVPPEHTALLEHMSLIYQDEDYLFVHAGVNPDRPLEMQSAEDFLWIRGPFLQSRKSCDYVVVHGHTPQELASDERWRIGLDTGAYATGALTAVRLMQDQRRLIEVR